MRKLLNKINYRILSAALIAVILAGAVFIAADFIIQKPEYRTQFTVTGDVEKSLTVKSFDGYKNYTAVRGGKKYKSLKLSDIIKSAKPMASDNKIVLEGEDGFIAETDENSAGNMYIAYTSENAWEFINEGLPQSSNVKKLAAVWVVSQKENTDFGLKIISDENNIASITPGQFFMRADTIAPVFQGKSVKDASKGSLSVSVYTMERYIDVSIFAKDAHDLLIMGGSGQYGYDSGVGKVKLNGNLINYVFSDGRTQIKDVRGVIVNPPPASIMDVCQQSVNSIENGEKVLVVSADGLSYEQCIYAQKNGFAPFLSGKEAVKATAVYPSDGKSGLAAVLTGRPPFENGIYNTGSKTLRSNDIFSYVLAHSGKTAFAEGDLNILNKPFRTFNELDNKSAESSDAAACESAKKDVQSGADFIFADFKEFENSSDGGTASTMEKIKKIDGYIQSLTDSFHGLVIITSTHGAPKGNSGFDYENMIVPYISFYKQ